MNGKGDRLNLSPFLWRTNATGLARIAFADFRLLIAVTQTVKLDGTGDYTVIQQAIDACADGDTVRVWPGTYYENLIIDEMSITLTSLYEPGMSDSLILNTIIDGMAQSNVIRIMYCDSVIVSGFTITNGYAHGETEECFGGGVYAHYCNIAINSCFINNNTSELVGGGISCRRSQLQCIDSIICFNSSRLRGGGVDVISSGADFITDPDYRCSIYGNRSAVACDIFLNLEDNTRAIYLDTLSVLDPSVNEVYFFENQTFFFDYNLDVLHGWLERIPSDLYVSPDGDDDNDGTSPDSAFQTLDHALLIIDVDEEHPRTIHLAPGVYSAGQNNQRFPFGFRDYVTIQGAGIGQTILDMENLTPVLRCTIPEFHVSLKDMTIINARNESMLAALLFDVRTPEASPLLLENIEIVNCHSDMELFDSTYANMTARNIRIKNCTSDGQIMVIRRWYESNIEPVIIENCLIDSCGPWDGPDVDGPIALSVSASGAEATDYPVYVTGMQITNCYNNNDFWPTTASALGVFDNIHLYLTNSTIADNRGNGNGGAVETDGENVHLTINNSVLWGNTIFNGTQSRQILAGTNTRIDVCHSLVQGGMTEVGNYWNCDLFWDHNIEEDPLWSSSIPFYPSSVSPCIDTGATLPDSLLVYLPDNDLLGDPRIYGDQIDLGCYEWNPMEIDNVVNTSSLLSFTNYPNPFNPTTTICFSVPEASKVEMDIYNIKGQKVKRLVNDDYPRGNHKVQWQGVNETGRQVSSGVYFYRLKVNGKSIGVKKMLMLK